MTAFSSTLPRVVHVTSSISRGRQLLRGALAAQGFSADHSRSVSAKKADVRQILKQIENIKNVSHKKMETVRMFYEQGWSSKNLEVLDSLIAEDHIQADRVWQTAERGGRESVKRGIAFIRRCYPDVRFTVDEIALSNDGSSVFARWTMKGTFEGHEDTASGLALLTVNNQNLITRTEVFRTVDGFGPSSSHKCDSGYRHCRCRQATRAEVELAKRSERGPVEQGALLEQADGSEKPPQH